MKKYCFFTLSLLFSLIGCTDLGEEMYDTVGAGNFLQKRENVLQVLSTSYAYAHSSTLISWFFPQELTADQILTPTRGIHGYNAGEYLRYNQHTWTELDRGATMAWNENYSLVGFTNTFIEDIGPLDYTDFGLTAEDKAQHIAESRTLRAFAYWHLLDIYGGVPLVTSVTNEVATRNSSAEVFDFIEAELNESLADLNAKVTEGDPTSLYRITKAANRFLLMRLYFNSEAYIGTPKYNEAKEIAEQIINGDYGPYELDDTWNGPFNWNNNMSPELIFAFPIEKGQRDEKGWWFGGFHHYESHLTFGSSHGGTGWNGWGLAPSITAEGEPLDYRIGTPFARYHPKDLRKKSWNNLGNGQWEGMFLQGLQFTYDGADTVRGVEEYKGEPLVLVDYVARMSEGDTDSFSMLNGEENTGIRPVKITPPFPDVAAQYQAEADQPEMRLAEVYYTLAECVFRLGDTNQAAQLLNEVISRNYEEADWNSPALNLQVTAQDLDGEGYRFLEEWAKEFIMEGRRRTDLIRWNKYTTETWFDHNQPSESFRRLMPIPEFAINSNPLLEQNPGY
ncbi:MAG: RagB/SusD family nutrient uptake outer membrane protein [Anditalea sp.]